MTNPTIQDIRKAVVAEATSSARIFVTDNRSHVSFSLQEGDFVFVPSQGHTPRIRQLVDEARRDVRILKWAAHMYGLPRGLTHAMEHSLLESYPTAKENL
jgi:hypothetical protein